MSNMKVVAYLNKLCKQGVGSLAALGMLKEELGIKHSQNEKYPDLYCLNYDQISSPKLHPIVRECRSLVLGVYGNTTKHGDYYEEFYVVSRSFDRFFNYQEVEETSDININELVAVEKVDGSLVSMFYYQDKWLYRTRSMIMPDESMTINGTKTTWHELIDPFVGFMECFSANISEHNTYIFEVVSPQNRVVTRYDEPAAYFLGARENKTGKYVTNQVYLPLEISIPEFYIFNTMESCLSSAKSLPNLEEGYVMCTKEGEPVMKVKSPAYVAAHRLRGETILTGKRVMDMIFLNEQEEYLSIFPEDEDMFNTYLTALSRLKADFEALWVKTKNIEDQKEFALSVKESSISSLLFNKRKDNSLSFDDIFDKLFTSNKYKLIEGYVQ